VRVFLDENFPLTLVYRLRDDGHDAEPVITVGWRGASDARIAERLVETDLLFLTQDEDLLFARDLAAVIVLSRVKQARPLELHPRLTRDDQHAAIRHAAESRRARQSNGRRRPAPPRSRPPSRA
jgi:hypothetical protein